MKILPLQNSKTHLPILTLFLFLVFFPNSHLFASEDPASSELQVLAIKPSTLDSPSVDQITVSFNKPMVPLGDFEDLAKDFPINISPDISCQWRWLNRQTLACQLNKALPASNAYSVTVSKGVKAFDGSRLEKPATARFSTKKWKVVYKRREWLKPDLPLIYMAFNQPMNLDSLVTKTVSTCGSLEIIAIEKKKAQRFGMDPARAYQFSLVSNPGLDRDCKIIIPKTAESALGKEPGKKLAYSFKTYPEFRVQALSCYKDNKISFPYEDGTLIQGCDPDSGLHVRFSSPVLGKDLSKHLQTDPQFGWTPKGYGSPEYYEQNPGRKWDQIFLAGPIQPRSRYKIILEGMEDRFGREIQGPARFSVEAQDFRPSFNLSSNFGVLERKGPYKTPFTSINVDSFDLSYFKSNSPDDILLWEGFRKSYDQCRGKISKKFASRFKLDRQSMVGGEALNMYQTLPLDLKKISPDFKFGMFLGRSENISPREDITALPISNYNKCQSFFLVVTDLGIMSKVGFYDSGVWIHSISEGKPLSNVKVSLRSYDKILTQAVTDNNGFAKLAGAKEWDPDRRIYQSWKQPLFVVAETEDDLSVLPFENGRSGINNYNFSNYEEGIYLYDNNLLERENHIVHVIPDRPLYQPGQEVRLKFVARHWEPETFGLRPEEKATIVVNDSMGKDIFKKDIQFSEFGTAHTQFRLDPGSSLGSFSIRAKIGKWNRYIGNFNVQEFKLPPFKVKVEASSPFARVDESLAFKTKALYHFGGGVAKTRGEYNVVFNERRWTPKKREWKKFNFDNPVSLHLKGYEKPRSLRTIILANGNFETDSAGNAEQVIELKSDPIHSYGRINFESKIKDNRGKTIAGFAGAEVFYSDFQLGLRKKKWTNAAGEDIETEVILVGPKEQVVSSQKVELKLVHRKYNTVRIKSSGNYYNYETRTQDEIIDSCEITTSDTAETCLLTPKAAGAHFIVGEVKDSHDRVARASVHVYVTGKEYVGWNRENHDRIDIIPDRPKYKVGDTISLLVKNPYKSVEGIFTLERFGILKQFRKTLNQGAELVSIPIDSKQYAPGFNLSVHLIKGRISEKIENNVDLGKPSFKMGLTQIKVVDPDSWLEIGVDTDRKEYRPGEEVSVSVKVASPSGPNRSELMIAVVDERILQLAGNYKNNYQLHDKFYQLPYGDVHTSQLLTELIGRRHYGKKGAPSGGDGGGVPIRKNFLPLAYWNPSLISDLSGNATFQFKTPDNLTGWKILVVALDKEHRFGFDQTSIKTNKKLMLEPALPSFLTEGDSLTSRVTVFNRTEIRQEVAGRLKLKGAKLEGDEELNISVESHSKANLEWPITAPVESKKAMLEVQAKSSQHSDGALYSFPIRPFLSYETFATYTSTTGEPVSVPIQFPEKIRTDVGGVNVIFSASLISHLDDVFRYAFNYPYSCWEQTLVRALMLNNYVQLKEYVSIPELKRDPLQWIDDLLGSMTKFQAPNGGMAYWKPQDRTADPYLSAFTGLGLVQLKRNGISIPGNPQDRLLKYIRRLLKGKINFPSRYNKRTRATVRAMGTYVLAQYGDNVKSFVEKSFEEKDLLSLFGKSFLWMEAFHLDKDSKKTKTLKKEIFSHSDQTSGSIQFKEVLDDGFESILHSKTRTNCNLLFALIETDPQSPFMEPLVRHVIKERKSNRWNNTQENLYCLNALANYAKTYETKTPDFSLHANLLGTKSKKIAFKGFKEAPKTINSNIPVDQVGETSEVRVEHEGEGRAYVTTRLRFAYKEVRPDPVNSGMQVNREYYLKNEKGDWERAEDNLQAKRGDLLKVRLKVKVPATRHQVALADSLPAGFEPLNTALASTSTSDAKGEKLSNANTCFCWDADEFWWDFYIGGGFYHREMRLHGAHYFADYLSPGEYTLDYMAQAIATGEFNVNPTLIEEMYHPEVYGKSAPAKFIVEE